MPIHVFPSTELSSVNMVSVYVTSKCSSTCAVHVPLPLTSLVNHWPDELTHLLLIPLPLLLHDHPPGTFIITNEPSTMPNVTIFLLFHNLLLLVCSLRIHILFGMYRYDYVLLLLVVHPFHSRMIVLWHPHAVPPYYWKGISLIFILLLRWTLPPPLGSLVPST